LVFLAVHVEDGQPPCSGTLNIDLFPPASTAHAPAPTATINNWMLELHPIIDRGRPNGGVTAAAAFAGVKLACRELTWSLKIGVLLERHVRFLAAHERRGRRPKETRPRHAERKSRGASIVRQVSKQNPIVLAKSPIKSFQLATQSLYGFAQRRFPPRSLVLH
jgi:hypothetical protein